jgi:opacity protein-like surface antigen
MKKAGLGFCVLAAACLSATAHAQTQGGFFGAGVLSASTDNARDFAAATFADGADKNATGFKVFGGYLWNQFGIEAGYYDLGTYDVFFAGTKSDDFSVSAFTISGALALRMNSQFTFNAKAGIAFTSVDYRCFQACGGNFVDTSDSDVAGVFGFGLAWRPARNFTLRADYESIGDVSHSVGLLEEAYPYRILSLSAQFNF